MYIQNVPVKYSENSESIVIPNEKYLFVNYEIVQTIETQFVIINDETKQSCLSLGFYTRSYKPKG